MHVENAITPLKINMEPKNHPIFQRNIIFQTSILGFHVNFPGCIVFLRYVHSVGVLPWACQLFKLVVDFIGLVKVWKCQVILPTTASYSNNISDRNGCFTQGNTTSCLFIEGI